MKAVSAMNMTPLKVKTKPSWPSDCSKVLPAGTQMSVLEHFVSTVGERRNSCLMQAREVDQPRGQEDETYTAATKRKQVP